ncbi:MAG: DUF861 domain-containing protein [Actinobacteria bacterium]|nr:DUF861 domain-containing protein [Actinomycetota bacterium]
MDKAVRMALGDLDGVEQVLEAGALTRTVERFSSGDGLTAGVWESEPFTEEIVAGGYPVDETCVVIEGTIVLRYPDGSEDAFGPGEAFSIARGTPLTWHQDDRVRKFYVIREPA